MSMLAIVTYDLRGAKQPAYDQVKTALAQHKLKKKIQSKKSGKLSRLPANIFAARFDRKGNRKNAKELCSYLRQQVEQEIKRLKLKATIFVAVGDGWAWGKRTV
jgi:hypothetical protein